MIILLLDLSPPLVLNVAVLIYKCYPVRIKVWGRDSFLSFLSFSIVCSLINSAFGDKAVSYMMFTRAQARRSEQSADGPFKAAPVERPTQEAVEKTESSPAEPAGPVPVPATPGVITTSEDGLGKNRLEGFSLAGQAGQTSSIEGSPRPPSEQGTCPLPGLATVMDMSRHVSLWGMHSVLSDLGRRRVWSLLS